MIGTTLGPERRRARRRSAMSPTWIWLIAGLLVAVALALSSGPPPAHGAFTDPVLAAGKPPKPTGTPKPTSTPRPTPTPTPSPTPSQPGQACATSTAPAGYAVTICITAPLPGATITGSVPVSLGVTQGSGSPGVRRATFTLNGGPLLTDYPSPYTFTLDSRRWGDATYTIAATVTMRDNWVSGAVSEAVTFANNQQQGVPNPNQFTPTSGTAPAPGAPLVVAAVGDGASGEPGEAATVGLTAGWNPNLFLYLGDVYEDGRPMEFNNWYGAAGTAGRYGQFRSITDPVIGNHEYVGQDATGYFYYWDNIPHAYSFDAGGWHFIALDSTTQYNQTNPGTAQYAWLQNDLASHASSACTIVFYHHPILNVGGEAPATQMAAMWQLFAQYRVTLVLNGHDHDYQRFTPVDGSLNPSPTGVTEIVVGSGGHGLQSQTTQDARLVASDFADFGAVRLQLYGASATFQFQSTNGTIVDSGLIPCRNTSDTTPPTAPSSVTASAPSPGEIDLGWTAATDDLGVAGYDVYKDGATTPVAVLPPDALGYVDTVVAPGSTHSYTVDAFDAAGNRSPPGGPASTTTPNGTVTLVLSPVADTYVNGGASTQASNYGSATSLNVAGSNSASPMVGYLKFDLSKVVGRITGATLGLMPTSSSNNGVSISPVAATDWGEYTTTWSTMPSYGGPIGASGAVTAGSRASIDVGSTVAPAQGGLVALAMTTTPTSGQIAFGSRESTTPPTLTITVASGAPGPPSAAFTPSTTSQFAGLPVGFTDTTGGYPAAWSWAFGDGGSSSLENPSHSYASQGTYQVTLTASNLYGSTSATQSITVYPDTDGPTAPAPVAASAAGPGEIDVSWTASTDVVGVTGYEVYRDGATTPTATFGPGVLSWADTLVGPLSTHSYTVDAFDAVGNRSPLAGPATATTPDGTVTYVLSPIADAYVASGSPASNFGTSTSLRVQNNGSGVANSYLSFDLSRVVGNVRSASLSLLSNTTTTSPFSAGEVATSSWGETTITYATAPPIGVAVASSGALTSGTRSSVDVTGLVAPAEGGPVTIGLTGSGGQTNLASRESASPPQLTIVVGSGPTGPPVASFSASATTGAVGTAVQFTDTSSGNPPTAWSWTFGDGAVSQLANPSHAWTAGGTYTVTLVASNLYGPSSPATLQVTVGADTTPPSVPGPVTATAAGSAAIDVAWAASTDDVGVAGYRIYRDGATSPTASVGGTTLTYHDTGLAAGSTHAYVVDAIDAAGNASAQSSPPASATTSSTVTYVLKPVEDAYVDSANPTSQFETSALRIKTASTQTMISFLRYDLSGISGTVVSATLTVTWQCGSSVNGGFATYAVDNTFSWAPGTLTWTTMPALGAASGTGAGPCVTGATGSAAVADLAAAALGGGLDIGVRATGTSTQEVFGSIEKSPWATLTLVVAP